MSGAETDVSETDVSGTDTDGAGLSGEVGWLARFVVAQAPDGFIAERWTPRRELAWSKGPFLTRIEAERALVLERTRAMSAGDDTGDNGAGRVPDNPPEVLATCLETLTVVMEDGSPLRILMAADEAGEPAVDPERVSVVLAGPLPGGAWVLHHPRRVVPRVLSS